jgi:tetratricopeptide (TPR) repeat protein
MPQAAGIFVSHAHEDNTWCRTFVQALFNAGASVWYDEHNLGYGALGEEIERELRARPIFLVILSPASVGKPWVRREMTAAITLRDRDPERIILPVVAEKTEIPLFWEEFKRVSGPGDEGLTATEAAGRVVHTLAIVPADAAAAPVPASTSETAEAAWERGQGLRSQKRYDEALAAYERALALDPQLTAAWNNKGRLLRHQKRYKEALEAHEQALALDPQFTLAWFNKGSVLWKLKRKREAREAERQRNAAMSRR